MVGFRGDYSPGTIVIKTNERRLYLVVGQCQAMRYPVGVGRAGKQWAGTTQIDGKYRNPAWSPPSEVRRDKPYMPAVIPGGSPRNPMGVAAMTLAGGEYAIHGTNSPGSIGVNLWLHHVLIRISAICCTLRRHHVVVAHLLRHSGMVEDRPQMRYIEDQELGSLVSLAPRMTRMNLKAAPMRGFLLLKNPAFLCSRSRGSVPVPSG